MAHPRHTRDRRPLRPGARAPLLAALSAAAVVLAAIDPFGATAALSREPAGAALPVRAAAAATDVSARSAAGHTRHANARAAAPAAPTVALDTSAEPPPAAADPSGPSRTEPTRPAIDLPENRPITVPRASAGGTALFLGDSYTSGWRGVGTGPRGWPRIVAAAMGWRVVNLAVAGTGFVNPGWTGQPIGSRVATAVSRRPDVVVVAGGHNDSRWSAGTTAAAADRVLRELRAGIPDALIIVVGPIWQDGSPPVRCLVLRDRLRRTATAIDAVFVDPIADRWFAGSRHAMIGRDGIPPTDAGHRFIAGRLLARLTDPGGTP